MKENKLNETALEQVTGGGPLHRAKAEEEESRRHSKGEMLKF